MRAGLVLPPGVCIGEEFPDVSGSDRTQQGIGQSVQKHIPIAVSVTANIGFNLDTSQPQGPARYETMIVKT
jgi:hypothetical protein